MTDFEQLERSLALARSGLSPSAVERSRVHSRLMLSLGAVVTNGVLTNGKDPDVSGTAHPALQELAPRGLDTEAVRTVSSSPWAILKATGIHGLITASVLTGAGFSSGYWLGWQHAPGSTDSQTRQETLTTPVGSPAVPAPPTLGPSPSGSHFPKEAATASLPQPEPARGRSRPSSPAVSPGEPLEDDLTEEVQLLRRVERAIRTDKPDLALALLSEADRRFPDGALTEERQAARVMAHCRQDASEAQARASRFLEEHRASVYADRIRTLCGLDPSGGHGSTP